MRNIYIEKFLKTFKLIAFVTIVSTSCDCIRIHKIASSSGGSTSPVAEAAPGALNASGVMQDLRDTSNYLDGQDSCYPPMASAFPSSSCDPSGQLREKEWYFYINGNLEATLPFAALNGSLLTNPGLDATLSTQAHLYVNDWNTFLTSIGWSSGPLNGGDKICVNSAIKDEYGVVSSQPGNTINTASEICFNFPQPPLAKIMSPDAGAVKSTFRDDSNYYDGATAAGSYAASAIPNVGPNIRQKEWYFLVNGTQVGVIPYKQINSNDISLSFAGLSAGSTQEYFMVGDWTLFLNSVGWSGGSLSDGDEICVESNVIDEYGLSSASKSNQICFNWAGFTLTENVFGSSAAAYSEDGLWGYCVKLSPTTLKCLNYAAAEDATVYLPAGAKIKSHSFLESSAFIQDDSNQWYSMKQDTAATQGPVVRGGSPAVMQAVVADTNSPADILYTTGHHWSGCFLHADADISCFGQSSTSSTEQINQDGKFVYTTADVAAYVDTADNLYINHFGYGVALSPSFSATVAAAGVEAFLAGTVINSTNRTSLTLYTNGDVAQSNAANAVGATRHTTNPHSGATKAVAFHTNQTAYVDTAGQLIALVNGVLTVITSMGTTVQDVEAVWRIASLGKYQVLDASGKVYSSSSLASFSPASSRFGGSLYDDFISIKGYAEDFCAVRANGDIYCAGTLAGGTFASPTFMGSYTP